MNLKTPGVYVQDASPVLPSAALLETGLPVFIGYTERAEDANGRTLDYTPRRIRDLGEYEVFFGRAYRSRYFEVIVDRSAGNHIVSTKASHRFYMYDCIRHYFDNGGGDCYIIATGRYTNEFGQVRRIDKDDFLTGLEVLKLVSEPDLIVFPDAVALKRGDGSGDVDRQGDLYQKALQHCFDRKNRFLIADIIPGDPLEDPVGEFREKIGMEQLKYGAVYYPWLYTNYTHIFHLCEFQFFEEDSRGRKIPLTDLSVFTSQKNSDGARAQQQLFADAYRWNKTIEQMIDLLKIDSFEREEVAKLEFQISRAANMLSSASADALSDTVRAFFDLVRPIAKSFVNLDGSIPPALQSVLTRKITADSIPDHTEQLIAWEKSEGIRSLILPTPTEAEVHQLYDQGTALSGSPWINQSSVADIDAAVISGSPEETLTYIRTDIVPLAKALAYSLKSLFDEAFAREAEAESALFTRHPFYRELAETLSLELKKIPPSATMAGIYAETDRETGTWKAPANIRIQTSLGPVLHIDDQKQENLNVHSTGKSVNVIRAITGRGTRVWGARTLDGNSLEWRYVPVRRYFNFIEEVIKRASETFVFEPNASATWVRMRLFLRTFLTRQWRQGALNGDTTQDAFFVNIGLGESMTETDVLEGRMIVEVGLAVVRPRRVYRGQTHLPNGRNIM